MSAIPSAQAALQALHELESAAFDCTLGHFRGELSTLRQFIEGAESQIRAAYLQGLDAGHAEGIVTGAIDERDAARFAEQKDKE